MEIETHPYEPQLHLESIQKIIDSAYRSAGDPGIDIEGCDSDLQEEPNPFRAAGGEMVIAKVGGKVVGCHAVHPLSKEPNGVTFRRLYVDVDYHGKGVGPSLMKWALDFALKSGYDRVEFWSDVRFERAHQFFTKWGFLKSGKRRTCEDYLAPYSEFEFYRDLDGGWGQP